MLSPKISVIIPVYNAEKTVGNILEKLISQNYKNIEIIAVNDGSKDDSWKILQKFAKKDKRIITINQKNAGASAARNVGIEKAAGDFITFIDSDDDISDQLILTLAKQIKKNMDFIMCGMSINGKEIVAPDTFIKNKKLITQYVLKSLLVKNLFYGPCCKLFLRSIILDNKIRFPEEIKYGEDTIFVLNYLSRVSTILIINQSLYMYQNTSAGLAASNNSILKYRKARSGALELFIRDISCPKIKVVYTLLKIRWNIAYIKALLLRNK